MVSVVPLLMHDGVHMSTHLIICMHICCSLYVCSIYRATVHRLYLRGWFAVDFISSIPLDVSVLIPLYLLCCVVLYCMVL